MIDQKNSSPQNPTLLDKPAGLAPLLETTPPFFSRRTMVAAPSGKHIYFFGGIGANTGTESILDVSDDFWSFDTQALSWKQIKSSGPWPSPRRWPGLVSSGNGILLWGGSGIAETDDEKTRATYLNDLWRFDIAGSSWECLRETDDHRLSPITGPEVTSFPSPRYTPVMHAFEDKLFLFGGYTEDSIGKRKMNDTWIFRDGAWHDLPAGGGQQGYREGALWPGVRYGSMFAGDGHNVYLCGGFADDGDHIDLWQFDMKEEKWRLLAPDGTDKGRPEPRYCAAMACFDGRLLLFGGRSRSNNPKLIFNDLWSFELGSGSWEKINGNREPHDYTGGAAFPGYHAKSGVAVVDSWWYIFGGEGLRGHVSDFWRFDLLRDEWQLIQRQRSDDPVFW